MRTGDRSPANSCDSSEARGIHHIGHYQLDPTSWHSTGPMHSFRDYHRPDLPSYEITRPPQYDGWRRATKPEGRFGFADEFALPGGAHD